MCDLYFTNNIKNTVITIEFMDLKAGASLHKGLFLVLVRSAVEKGPESVSALLAKT